MPTLFLYEHLTATAGDHPPAVAPLLRLGRAMRDAVAADFGALGWSVATSLPAEASLVIAPECGGLLAEIVRRTESPGVQSLNAPAGQPALLGDKLATWRILHEAGIPVADTVPLRAWRELPLPQVWKPRDGAGSMATLFVTTPDTTPPNWDGEMIATAFVPGTPASVGLLTGPGVAVALPATRQILGEGFTYLGAEIPLGPPLGERAAALARRAVAALPGLRGFVGVDLVLGDDPGGAGDRVIEVNARVCTSYAGLRRLCRGNLAAALLAACRGEAVPLEWDAGPIFFTPGDEP